MANAADSRSVSTEKVNLFFNSCIICQKENNECLVESPSSYEKVLKSIEEWALYGNLTYSESWERLRGMSAQDLELKRVSWHRSCYKEATHSGMLKRAKERYVIKYFLYYE